METNVLGVTIKGLGRLYSRMMNDDKEQPEAVRDVRNAIDLLIKQKARIHDLETLVDRIDHEDTVRFGGRSYD